MHPFSSCLFFRIRESDCCHSGSIVNRHCCETCLNSNFPSTCLHIPKPTTKWLFHLSTLPSRIRSRLLDQPPPLRLDAQALLSVRDGGSACYVGIAAATTKAEVPITHLVRRRISLVGSYGSLGKDGSEREKHRFKVMKPQIAATDKDFYQKK